MLSGLVDMRRKSNAVVFVGMSYPAGGIRHLALLANEIYKLHMPAFDFFIASITKEAHGGFWDTVKLVIPDERIITASSFDLLTDSIMELSQRYEAVIIHTGGGWGQTRCFINARRKLSAVLARRVHFVCTTHSFRNGTWQRIPMSIFQYILYCRFYRGVIFQCQYAADMFFGGRWLIRSGKGVIIPLGCETFPKRTDVVPQSILDKGLSQILLDSSLFKFIYLANFKEGKMHLWLIHTMASVLRKFPNARLLLCGAGESTLINKAQRLIAELGLEAQILIVGRVPRPDVPWTLQHSDCAVVPSRSETFGHCFLEPMFAGLPVIGTQVGIGKDIIIESVTGKVISLSNRESLIRSVTYMLQNPECAKRMGENAIELVSSRFRHSDVALRLSQYYNGLLSKDAEK